MMGFASQRQAFIGGDAGTKLSPHAERSLHAAANAVLKLYPWASCKIILQSGNVRQEQLATKRMEGVRLTLESACCRNSFELHAAAQGSLLTLSVSLLALIPQAPSQLNDARSMSPLP